METVGAEGEAEVSVSPWVGVSGRPGFKSTMDGLCNRHFA